jgi:hypothetical protein
MAEHVCCLRSTWFVCRARLVCRAERGRQRRMCRNRHRRNGPWRPRGAALGRPSGWFDKRGCSVRAPLCKTARRSKNCSRNKISSTERSKHFLSARLPAWQPACQPSSSLTPQPAMQNDAGEMVDMYIPRMYIPRKCSATNRLIVAGDYASVQFNIGHPIGLRKCLH